MKLTLNWLSAAGHIIVALLPVLILHSLITFAESRMHKTRPVRTLDYKHRTSYVDVFGHPVYEMQKLVRRSGDGPPDGAGQQHPPPPHNLPPFDTRPGETSEPNAIKNGTDPNNGTSRPCVNAFVILIPLLTALHFIHCIRV